MTCFFFFILLIKCDALVYANDEQLNGQTVILPLIKRELK